MQRQREAFMSLAFMGFHLWKMDCGIKVAEFGCMYC